MILILDNFDSFTYNLLDYFEQIGVICKVFRNNANTKEIFGHHYKGIVLSPGPGHPSSSGNLMEVIQKYQLSHPILGICLGHQAIGLQFGAELARAEKPMHGKLSFISHKNDIPFIGMNEKLQVVRYHSLILKNLSEDLAITAETKSGEIMAIRHKNLPIHGIQFHPEAILTEEGLQMLHNWARFYKLVN